MEFPIPSTFIYLIRTNIMQSEILKIIVADDSPTFRKGIISYLEQQPEFKVTHQVSNGKSLLSVIGDNKPDVILLDIKMPEMDGIECTKYIKKRYPDIKIIIISNYGELVFIRELTKTENGADAYLLKNVEKEEIIFAIKKVCKNGQYLCDEIRDKLETIQNFDDLLSPQEFQTLYYFWNGLTAEQIAVKVYRSKHAVDARFKSIYAKTACNNQRELMRYIVERNLNDVFKYEFQEDA